MSKIRWVVAIQSKTILLDRELSNAICRCLQQLGYAAAVVEDGEPAGFEAEIMLLLTNLGNFPAYGRRLKQGGAQRPITILWQLDPLPPEDLPPDAEAAGLRAARWKNRFRLHQSAAGMPRWKKIATLFRLREWANTQCSAYGYRKASRLIKRRGGDDIDWKQIRGVMGNWRRILDGHREGWLDHIAVSTHQRLRFLTRRGIPAHFIPVGAYDEMGRDMGLSRDIQVGFLGVVKSGRRKTLLDQLSARLEAQGVTLTRMVHGCYGENRCAWLNRTRILVSLHNFPWNPAWIRFLIAAKCGALVVSEPMNDEHPLKAGAHYVAATLEEMPEVIGQLLKDPERISRLANAAANLCNNELTLLSAMEAIGRLGGSGHIEKHVHTNQRFTA